MANELARDANGKLFCHNVFHDEDGKNPTHFNHAAWFEHWTKSHGFVQDGEWVWRKVGKP